MSRLWLFILVSFSLAACSATAPTQVEQPAASVSQTTVAAASSESTTSASAGATSQPTLESTATPESAGKASAAATTTTEDVETNLVMELAPEDMLFMLNERRSENNCPELKMDGRMRAAAQSHAEDIARSRRVNHVSSDGTTFEQRLGRVGYPFQRRAEILSLGFGLSPRVVVDQWLSEPEGGEHRGAILDCEYRDVGIGVAQTKQNITFWVVNFGLQKP